MSGTKKNPGIRVLAAGSILQLFLGVIYVWSVFVVPVSTYYSWEIESAKLTSSFMLSCFVLGILVGGRLQKKLGAARIVLFGGLAMAIGMAASSVVPLGAPWLIYITYGILGGFGVGMAYNAIITAAQQWFVQKRGLATGISVCMFGFSTVVFAPLVESLISRYALTNTLRILAVAFAVVTLALFSFIKFPQQATQAANKKVVPQQRQYTSGELLKSKAFYCLTLSMMFLTASYFILNPSFKTLALERGLSETLGTTLVMITGIANAAGRLAVPVLAGKIGSEKATITILAVTAACTAFLIFAQGTLFIVAVALIALCYGGSSGIYPITTADYFGIQNVGSNYGMVMVGFMTSSLLFPMIFGRVESPMVKFLSLALLCVVGIVLVLVLMRSKQKTIQPKETV